MPHPYDHASINQNLLIYQMVRNRLPFIEDNPANQAMLSGFTWELMNQLEVCFKIADQTPPNNVIGEEENYSVLQQSIIADLVATYVLLLQAAGGYNFSSTPTTTTSNTTYIKKAKAGSVEVEYDQFDAAKGATSTAIGNQSLLNFYKKNAISKAAGLGCIIDVCDDCSITVMNNHLTSTTVTPFIVVSACGCSN